MHMQNTNRRLHENTLEEEQVVSRSFPFSSGVLIVMQFLDLSGQVMAAHGGGFPMRRHSVDVTGSSYGTDTTSSDRVFLGTGLSLSGIEQRE